MLWSNRKDRKTWEGWGWEYLLHAQQVPKILRAADSCQMKQANTEQRFLSSTLTSLSTIFTLVPV